LYPLDDAESITDDILLGKALPRIITRL
jgi:hypothetical protein